MEPIDLTKIIPPSDWEIVSLLQKLIVWSPFKRANPGDCQKDEYFNKMEEE